MVEVTAQNFEQEVKVKPTNWCWWTFGVRSARSAWLLCRGRGTGEEIRR